MRARLHDEKGHVRAPFRVLLSCPAPRLCEGILAASESSYGAWLGDVEEIEKITGANCRAVLHALKEERLEKHARMLGLLKALGAEPEAGQAASESGKDDYPLISAAGNGDAERAAGLIKDGADVNGTDGAGCTALIASVYGGNLGIAEMLLDNGADISLKDGDGNTVLAENGFLTEE